MVAAYAESLGVDARAVGWELLLTYGEDQGILFVHGFGSSQYRPQSPAFLAAVTRRVVALLRLGLPVTRVCHGHLHWFDTGLEYAQGVKIDSLGGLQACRRAELGFADRPPGGILYHYDGTSIEVTPIRPGDDWIKEAEDPSIVARNLRWIGDALDEWDKLKAEGADLG